MTTEIPKQSSLLSNADKSKILDEERQPEDKEAMNTLPNFEPGQLETENKNIEADDSFTPADPS